MESFFGRFKVENRSLDLDAESVDDLKTIVGKRIKYLQSGAPSLLPRRSTTPGNHPGPLPRGLNGTINPRGQVSNSWGHFTGLAVGNGVVPRTWASEYRGLPTLIVNR